MPEPADVEPKDKRTSEWKAWKARQDVAPAVTITPAPPVASSDVAFLDDALVQILLRGKVAGKFEQCYSDTRSILDVKHMLEDAAGLKPTGRITLPHWDTLNRHKDSGEPFDAKTIAAAKAVGLPVQTVADNPSLGAVPAPKKAPRGDAAEPRAAITNPDGTPFRLPRTKIDEPDVVATFVSAGGESAE